MNKNSSIIIVGSGIIGACSAYYLNKAGFEVTIVEKDQFGKAASHGNCGLICPSHAMPLCEPGALLRPFKSMMDAHSPFYVNPRVGPSLWGWMLRFAMNCTHKKAMASARARNEFLQSSIFLYRELIEKEKMSVEWQDKGLLFVHTKEESFHHLGKLNELMTREFSLSAKPYDSKAVVNLEPALLDTVVGGWHYEGDAHLRPDLLMSELKRVLLSKGVKILEETVVTQFNCDPTHVKAVKTNQGEIECDMIVLATGALAPKLSRQLGTELHIQPGKGYSITTNHPDPCPKIPLILEDHSVAVTPFDSGYRLGSTMEFTGYDDSINRKRISLLADGAKHYLKDIKGDHIEEEWAGWRPMSHSDLPAISQTPRYENAWIAAGHSMLGISLGSGTGKLLTELICGDQPHVDPTPYRL